MRNQKNRNQDTEHSARSPVRSSILLGLCIGTALTAYGSVRPVLSESRVGYEQVSVVSSAESDSSRTRPARVVPTMTPTPTPSPAPTAAPVPTATPEPTAAPTPAPVPDSYTPYGGYVTALCDADVYQAASADTYQIDIIPKGKIVVVIGVGNNGWSQVQYHGGVYFSRTENFSFPNPGIHA